MILDIGLPKMDGISVLEVLAPRRPRHAGADPHRARPLERQGAGLRRQLADERAHRRLVVAGAIAERAER